MKRRKLFWRFFPLTLVLGALFSCASTPRPASFYKAPPNIFSPLESGGTAYFYIDVKNSRPILDEVDIGLLSRGGRERQILDMTESAVAAFYPETGGRRYMAAARGKYPGFRASLSFTFSSAWKKRKSPTGNSFWRSEKQDLSVFLSGSRAYVSDGDPFVETPGYETPPEMEKMIEGALIAGTLNDAREPISRFLNAMGLALAFPADRVVFGVYGKSGESGAAAYEGLFRVETPSPREARAVEAIFSLARMFLASGGVSLDAGLLPLVTALFTNAPQREGASLVLRTGPLSAGDIALLFNMFAVYSPLYEENNANL